MTYPTKKLEELVDFQGGLWTAKTGPRKPTQVLRNTNFRSTGLLDFSDVAEIEVEEKQLASRLLQSGDLLLERSGGGPTQPVGRVMYFSNGGEFSFSNFTARMRVRSTSALNSMFLWRYLNYLYDSGFTERLQKQTTGIRNLIFSDYKQIEIPLPPIAEQRKIVEKIEKQFAKIDEAARLREEAQTLAEKLLPAALHEIFSSVESMGWEEKELGEVAPIHRKNNSDFLPYVGMEDIQSGTGDFIGSKEPQKVLSNTFYFDENCLLYGRLRPYLNKVLLPDFEGHCSTELFPLVPDQKAISREFLFYWMTQQSFIDQAMNTAEGSRMPRADMKKVIKFKIPLPPLTEQKKIVKKLDALSEKVRAIRDLQSSQSENLKSLKQSILHEAFKQGE